MRGSAVVRCLCDGWGAGRLTRKIQTFSTEYICTHETAKLSNHVPLHSPHPETFLFPPRSREWSNFGVLRIRLFAISTITEEIGNLILGGFRISFVL